MEKAMMNRMKKQHICKEKIVSNNTCGKRLIQGTQGTSKTQ